MCSWGSTWVALEVPQVKSAQNDLLKRDIKDSLYVALEGANKMFFYGELKNAKKMKKKMPLPLQLMVCFAVQSRLYLPIYVKAHKKLPGNLQVGKI